MRCLLSFFITLALLACGATKQPEEVVNPNSSGEDIKLNTSDLSKWETPAKIEMFGSGILPKALPGGNLFSFTQADNMGLWIMDTRNHERRELSSARGAGFEPFITDRYLIHMEQGKKKKWILVDKKSNTSQDFRSRQAALQSIDAKTLDTSFVFVGEALDRLHIIGEIGDINEIRPGKYKNYTNAELSPSKDRIVFEVAGMGAFICDLEGDIKKDLGDIDHVTWFSDDEIVFLQTEDDGMSTTSSKLYILDIRDDRKVLILEDLDGIISNPSVLRESGMIVANWKGSTIIGLSNSVEK